MGIFDDGCAYSLLAYFGSYTLVDAAGPPPNLARAIPPIPIYLRYPSDDRTTIILLELSAAAVLLELYYVLIWGVYYCEMLSFWKPGDAAVALFG